jgi:hypothetical protein
MTTTPDARPSHRFALVWYGFAFALLGVCIGLMAGMSLSPVIGVLLPLLFSLIGGAGGLYLAGIDVEDPKARRKLRALGIVLSAFSACVLVASLYGALLRTGAPPESLFLPPPNENEAPAPAGDKQASISASGRLELVVLRRKLQALGADPAEQRAILAKASSGLEAPYGGQRVQQLFLRLQALARQAREAVSTAPPSGDPARDRAGAEISGILERLDHAYGAVAERARSLAAPSMVELRSLLEADEQRLSQSLHDDAGAAWANERPKSRAALWALELSMLEELSRIDDGAWMAGGRVAKEANELLATLSASDKPRLKQESILPAFAP